MNKIIFALICVMLITTPLFPQDYQPNSPLKFEKNSINKNTMSQKISAERKLFNPLDIDELKIQIKKNNNAVDNRISGLKNKMTNIFMDKQELLKLVDIKKMQEQITVKQKSRKDIKEQIQQDLKSIVYKGLYLVVLKNIDPWFSKEKLAQQAEQLLAPTAIENLNGVFISSLTIVKDNSLLRDQIKANISGEMSVEKQYISKIIDNRSKYVYLIKVNVAPLKKSLTPGKSDTQKSSKNFVLNLLENYGYEAKLQTAGIPSNWIKNIDFEAKSSRDVINGSNNTSNRRQQQIIRMGNANLTRIDEDIKQLQRSLTNRSAYLQQTIEEKTNVTYNANRIKDSIDRALKYFDDQLDELKNKLIAAKEGELISKYDVNVTVEGRPEQDIAGTSIDIYKQIKSSYSKVEQFIRESEVVNNMLVSDKTASGQDIFREVEKIWLYPVAGDMDNFLLTVVAKFKITDIKHSGTATIRKRVSDTFPDMKYVTGGTFKMGSNNGESDEKPVHKVYVDDFYMDKYEVTNAQFSKFLNEKGNQKEGGATWLDISDNDCKIVKQRSKFVPVSGYANHPAIEVTWYGARAYANWAGKRLPTEAEWEYAARGGSNSKAYKYSGSNSVGTVAWYNGNSGNKTHPVGTKQPNELGLFDMSGNVWEWCADWYGKNYYNKSPYENPTGPTGALVRVLRGGSWSNSDYNVRCANRYYYPFHSSYNIGFRCVR
jgi:formylglycine-generating enzyme